MIQDIAPHKYSVAYKKKKAEKNDFVLVFSGDGILIFEENEEIRFPTVEEVGTDNLQFLFTIDNSDYFMTESNMKADERFSYYRQEDFRELQPMWRSFAVLTGFQLHRWYTDNNFCGRCGNGLITDKNERALRCPECGNVIFPKISPSVIIGVTDRNKILLTKYSPKHSAYRKYTLVAGYVETGESPEDTVRREVMEEVGLKVKNIKYYKSQPWSLSDTLLLGYFCELDGDGSITLEEDELSCAKWFEREEIPQVGSTISLTNEMIEYFRKNGKY